MQLKTSCPKCDASLSVTSELLGGSVKCPRCQTKFVVADVRSPSSDHSLENAAAATETMAEGTTATASMAGSRSTSAATIKVLGRFEIQGVLGQGGFGRVYKAYDPQLERLLALKVPTFGPQDGKKAKRFQSEAKAAAQLRHPNIVPTFESGKIGNQFFIASQFIDGEPMSAITKVGRTKGKQAAEWIAKVARALAYAHEMGIIHRDVKPHNVMLDERGEPQLMDFGLAKRLNDDSGMTADGAVLGTPAYMAPEQARGDMDQVGPHTDQYALGAILYELLTSRRAFEGAPHVVMAKILSEEPPAPRSLAPKLPRDLEAITQKAMSKEISRRYASCAELADDLDRWRTGEATLARPISTWERMSRWIKRNRGLAAAFAATAAALLLVAVLGISLASYQSYAARQIQDEQQKTLDEQRKIQTLLNDVTKERDRAESQTKLAVERQQAETEQRELADKRLEEARQTSYISNIRLASAKWDAGDVTGMNTALDSLRPGLGEVDRRGWEWNYLWNLSHSEISSFNIGAPEQQEGAPRRYYNIDAISPDGRQILRSGDGVKPCLLDSRTGAILLELNEQQAGINGGAVFSPDGTKLYVCNSSGQINCWSTTTGEKHFIASGGPAVYPYSRLSVSDDGTKMANGGAPKIPGSAPDGTYPCIWDAATGKHLTTLAVIDDSWRNCVLSPDGQLAAIPTSSGLQIYDADTGKLHSAIETPYYFKPSFSPDGLHLATGTLHGVSIWSIETSTLALTIPLVMPVDHSLWVQYGRDGRSLAIHYHETLAICDARDGTVLHSSKGQGIIHHFCYTSDGRRLITGARDGTVKIWDACSTLNVLVADKGEGDDQMSVKVPLFSSNERSLFLAGAVGENWDLESGQRTELYRPTDSEKSPPTYIVMGVAENRIIGTAAQKGEICGWNRNTGQKEQTLKVTELKSSADANATEPMGNEIFSSWFDSVISKAPSKQFWNSACKLLTSIEYSPDESLLLYPDRDGSVVVWDAEKREPLHRFSTGTDSRYRRTVRGNFSPSGDIVSSILGDGIESDSPITQWNVKSGEKLPKLRNQFLIPDRVAVDSHSTRVVASSRGDIRIWDMKLRDEVLTIRRPFEVNSNVAHSWIAISPDNSCLAMSVQGKVVIYDGRPESELKTRAIERAARSTVAYFRKKTKNQDESVAAIQSDSTISEEARALAVEFTSRPPLKIIELQP